MIDIKNLVTLPYYTTQIPSTGKLVSFRPFIVKEEKILLMAKQSNDKNQILTSIKQILKNCFKEPLDVDNMPYFDIQFLFTQLRIKSMGETVEIVVTDPKTKEKFDTELNLEKLKIENFNKNKNMMLKFNDKFAIEFRYSPLTIYNMDGNLLNGDIIYDVAADSIKTIYSEDQITSHTDVTHEELKELIESLTNDMFNKIINFLADSPILIYHDVFKSPSTGNDIPVIINNFSNFFH